MDKNILYITFVDFNEQKSGSSVRPKKIYDSFIEQDYKVELLTGLQNRKLERWKSAWKYFKKIRKNKYDFCYVEPPAGPIFNFCDHLLLLYVAKIKKVNIGLFYRDAYWKFADWYELNGIKKLIVNTMHRFDWFIIKNACKMLYFPTDMMGDLFDISNKESLPPGCEINEIEIEDKECVEIVYVGSMSEQYGGPLLLAALDRVNKEKEMNLHLVCREDDRDKIKNYIDRPWLKVYHTSGKGLIDVYKKANISIIPRKIDFYMDLAMPVKLFEYISFGLPIISTNCKEVAKFIEKNEIGIICEDNVEGIYNTLMSITLDNIKKYSDNVKITRINNTWNKRVEQISKLKDL